MRAQTNHAAAAISRRTLLKAAAVSGALVLGVELPLQESKAIAASSDSVLNAFLRIAADDQITLVMPRVEMGQGTYTSLAMLLAEELEVDPARVHLEHAPADDRRYGRPGGGVQSTGGSTSVRLHWVPMRQAGAAARMMLVRAAAQQWQVEAASCHAENGAVVHAASGRRLPYGALAVRAAQLPVPATNDIVLKRPEDFRRIGGSQLRLDGPEKVNGSARYGIDVIVPGMLIATVAASPVFGGRVREVNEAAALRVHGVRQVVRLDDVVAVVADHMHAARKGLAAANVQWNEGPAASFSTQRMVADMAEVSQRDGATARKVGDVAAARARGARTIDAVYQQPFLAHAAMEPLSCTVHVRADACELWLGTQVPTRAQAAAAAVVGLPPEKVAVHNHLLGGAFGRRLDADFVTLAVRIGREVKGPVKVVWTREEDMQHSTYRPSHFNRLSATLDAEGRPIAWQHRVTGSAPLARYDPSRFKDNVDGDAIRDAAGPYDFPNILVQFVRLEPPEGMLTGFWRGVGHTQNVFPVECFLDELAQACGADPVEYRKSLLARQPRARRVLELAAEKAGWGRALPNGRARGIALASCFGSYVAQVTEVSVAPDGSVRPDRVVTVVDCGRVVSPRTVEAQVQGGTLFGLSAALFGRITLRNGRVEQSNFHDYRVLRMNETPVLETHIVPSSDDPGGVGEVATVVAAPALANALSAATGKRVHSLPLAALSLKDAA